MLPEGQFDIQQLLQQAQQVQEQVMAAQAEIAEAEVEGQAGGGLVQVRAKTSGELVALRIDPSVIDPQDPETLQDLVIGAVNEAAAAGQQLASDRLGPLTEGLPGV